MSTESPVKNSLPSGLGAGIVVGLILCAVAGVMAFRTWKSDPKPEPDKTTTAVATPPASQSPETAPAPALKPATPPPTPQQMFQDQINKLTPEQRRVTQHSGTERPFTGEFWDHKEDGVYVDVVSGKPLFSSLDKFDSGCGWPSFSKPLVGGEIKELQDDTLGMKRVEVRSSTADSHLGHVFEDGPTELGGLRYCINSASLRFVPVKDLEKEGLGDYLKLFQKKP